MKEFVLRAAALVATCLLGSGAARAQPGVPNGAMETWVTRNGDAPAQWRTTDDFLNELLPGFALTNAVTKSTTSHAGSFAARLTNSSSLLGTAPGYMVLGNSFGNPNVDSLAQLGGLPYTARPARLQFYYRFSGTIARPDDRPLVRIEFTKTTNGVRQTIASAHRYLTAAAAYTLADFPLIYQRGAAPDSVHIAFGSADFDGVNFTVGNTLFVDDIALVGTVTASRDAHLPSAFAAYPNPSSTGLFTLSTADAGLLAGPCLVTDALGREVVRQPAAPADGRTTRTVDLRQQAAGLYFLRLDTERGPITKQLVVQ